MLDIIVTELNTRCDLSEDSKHNIFQCGFCFFAVNETKVWQLEQYNN